MASLNSFTFEIGCQPCFVDNNKALFHKWGEKSFPIDESPLIGGHPAGFVKTTIGIVEFADGTVKEVANTPTESISVCLLSVLFLRTANTSVGTDREE